MLRSLLTFLTTLYILNGFSQVACEVPAVSEEQLTLLQRSHVSWVLASQKSRQLLPGYTIPVQAIVVHPTGAEANPFDETELSELINHANSVFRQINLQFVLLPAQHVYSDQYVNLHAGEDADLINRYQSVRAINVYFVKTYTNAAGKVLNGSAALPDLTLASNRLTISYFDNSPDEFKQVKERVFLHEMGHYFGLLHTFQDSNHPDLMKRELVERDIAHGANCLTAGDQLCDTPADPFERDPSLLIGLGCNQPSPPQLTDLKGYTYSPPSGNIMSYQVSCGNYFTPQQYQRMQAQFAIRFSPMAAYQLVGSTLPQFTLSNTDKSVYCPGEAVSVNYSTFGFSPNVSQLRVLISDEKGENFSVTSATVSGNTFTVAAPTLPNGSTNLRLMLEDPTSGLRSLPGDFFAVYPKQTIQLWSSDSTYRPGDPSPQLYVQIVGKAPVSYTLSNGQSNAGESGVFTHSVAVNATSTFRVTAASTGCGVLALPPPATIVYQNNSLELAGTSTLEVCQGKQLNLGVNGLRPMAQHTRYEVVLEAAGSKTTLPATRLTEMGLVAAIPTNLPTNLPYKLLVQSVDGSEFSRAHTLKVNPAAAKPMVEADNLTLCFGEPTKAFKAEGSNLIWYNDRDGVGNLKTEMAPNSLLEGNTHYYVFGNTPEGCPSEVVPIRVWVKPQAVAHIDGDTLVVEGKPAQIDLKFKGDLPWRVELSDGQTKELTDASLRFDVTPRQTTAYRIMKATNACGEAKAEGEALVRVQLILGTATEPSADFTVFPNPVIETATLRIPADWRGKTAQLGVYDMQGKRVYSETTQFSSDYATLQLANLPEGQYLIQATCQGQTRTKAFVKGR